MKRVVLAVCLAVVVAGSLAIAAQGRQDFVLRNRIGQTIDELYISPTTTDEWEEDVLDVDLLENGEDVTIHFPRDEDECLWDFKIITEDDTSVVWTKIDLCKASEVTLLIEGGKPIARIK
ncbi:MAG: hypothetical protein AB1806_09480 [Acidobacteriota bacterium]